MHKPKKVGTVFALVLGGWHLIWALLVLTGFAQALYDFVLWAHMIHLQIVIGPFDMTAAIALVVFTTVFGYLVGYVGAKVWNWAHR